MMKEPTRSVKAVLLPSWIAPKAVQRIAVCNGERGVQERVGRGRKKEGCVAGMGAMGTAHRQRLWRGLDS